MMVWIADEVRLTDDDVHVGIGATQSEVLGPLAAAHRGRGLRACR